ncbi:MAG: glucose-6-phosphate isomerase [Bacteroidales bacterium]|nr:glucose-6-phosphate isomerase [Bacteroidales bacterium]
MKQIIVKTPHWAGKADQQSVSQTKTEILAAKEHLVKGDAAGNDFLGWVNLPEDYDKEEFARIKADVARLRSKSRIFVVIGIGGSYLGARMVIEALQSEFASLVRSEKPYIVYAGHTLGEDYYGQLLTLLDHEDYSVAVISKSGTTTEPAVAFRIVKAHLENKYGKEEATRRIVAITDARKGALHDIAVQEGYPMYVIPDNVGGRFSVLTPVGLLPIAMAGFDIDRLMQGARDMRKVCLEENNLETNPALMYAAIRNVLYRNGVKVEMLVSSLPNLRYLAEWWKQLYGESEGKQHKGLLPHSLSITTDLHSMGQYVQDGERLMMETMLRVKTPATHTPVPTDKRNLDGINYLTSKTLTQINDCATDGTIEAHVSGGVPVVEIEVERIDEYTLGQLIYFFEFACGVSGYTLGVNPFDQPGVEAYKKNMFRLLGKPGF